jgi:hypothetical protein
MKEELCKTKLFGLSRRSLNGMFFTLPPITRKKLHSTCFIPLWSTFFRSIRSGHVGLTGA